MNDDNTTQTERNAVFAVEALAEVFGSELRSYEYDFFLVKCFNHPEIDPLATKCLTEPVHYAEQNFENLQAKLRELFLIRRPNSDPETPPF